MKKLIIIGAGGHGKETAIVACDAGYDVVGFLDQDSQKHGKMIDKFPCLGGFEAVAKFQKYEFIIAIGSPRIRKKVVTAIEKITTVEYATIIHPTACLLSKDISIAPGSMIFPYACLTTNLAIGRHAIFNIKSSVSHDGVLGDFVTLNPSATICGTNIIGDGVELGAGATVIQNITIGAGAFVGAGATVVECLASNQLYVGTPAKYAKKLDAF